MLSCSANGAAIDGIGQSLGFLQNHGTERGRCVPPRPPHLVRSAIAGRWLACAQTVDGLFVLWLASGILHGPTGPSLSPR
jgi:hypothetical protein